MALSDEPGQTDESRDHSWPAEPLTSPVCPWCGRKERPHKTDQGPPGHVVYECPDCGRSWTVRTPDPKAIQARVTRRHQRHEE